jgi:hypothetical protein
MSLQGANAIIEPDLDEIETWKNVTRGRVVLWRLGALGQKRSEMIGADKLFHITPRERRMNQEAAANEDLDVFLNGTLQPVRLIETSDDFKQLTANPNLLGDDEQVSRLFRAGPDVFAARLAEIKNPSALERLLQLANQDETGATVAQLRMIQARLDQVQPPINSVHMGGEERPAIKPVTPK